MSKLTNEGFQIVQVDANIVAEFDPLEHSLHLKESNSYLLVDSFPSSSITDLQQRLGPVGFSSVAVHQIGGQVYRHLISFSKSVNTRSIADTLSGLGFPAARIASIGSNFEVVGVQVTGVLLHNIFFPFSDSHFPLRYFLHLLYG